MARALANVRPSLATHHGLYRPEANAEALRGLSDGFRAVTLDARGPDFSNQFRREHSEPVSGAVGVPAFREHVRGVVGVGAFDQVVWVDARAAVTRVQRETAFPDRPTKLASQHDAIELLNAAIDVGVRIPTAVSGASPIDAAVGAVSYSGEVTRDGGELHNSLYRWMGL